MDGPVEKMVKQMVALPLTLPSRTHRDLLLHKLNSGSRIWRHGEMPRETALSHKSILAA